MALNQAYLTASTNHSGSVSHEACRSLKLYRSAHLRSWLNKVRSALTGHSQHLLNISTVQTGKAQYNSHYAGTRAVPISRIRGSEGRCEDFDGDFWPTQTHTKGRWLGIAKAWQRGVTLPPVELVKIGDAYFVRDGHHRISVARAMGKLDIDAEVTVLQTA